MTTEEIIVLFNKINNEKLCTLLANKLKRLRELEDKATPKKPEKESYPGFDAEIASELVCPCCRKPIVNVWSKADYKPQYCHCCGQALDWRGEQER